MLFRCTIEDVAFTSMSKEHDPIELDLSENFLIGYSKTKREERTFPEGVLAVLKTTARPDDSVYEDGRDSSGVKLFVSIDLLIDAESQCDFPDTDRLINLLTHLTDQLSTELDLEGSWEYLEDEEMDVAGYPWLEVYVALETFEMDQAAMCMGTAMEHAKAANSLDVIKAAADIATVGGLTVYENSFGDDAGKWVLTKAGEFVLFAADGVFLIEHDAALAKLKDLMEVPTYELLAYQFEHAAAAPQVGVMK